MDVSLRAKAPKGKAAAAAAAAAAPSGARASSPSFATPKQAALHAVVGFRERGQEKAAPCAAFSRVLDHALASCEIPEDFTDPVKYGPLSGQSWESRVVAAYEVSDSPVCPILLCLPQVRVGFPPPHLALSRRPACCPCLHPRAQTRLPSR